MNEYVEQTRKIADAASLLMLTDKYLAQDNIELDDVLAALRNIIKRCEDDHHQSRQMATVAIKLIDGVRS